MSEMITRVAMAIDAAVAEWQPGSPQRIKEMAARAAIEALREPTADMVDAGRDVGPDAPYGLSETTERWCAMINAALR